MNLNMRSKMNTTICERRSTESQRPYSAKRQQHQVTFFCDAPGAEAVSLVGDFNGWDSAATPMRRTPDGRWTASLELHHGHHQYLFLVDGTPTLDPNASGVTRNDRNEVSLIAVS
jgi:1,4-alpha-glucan branching enzyme